MLPIKIHPVVCQQYRKRNTVLKIGETASARHTVPNNYPTRRGATGAKGVPPAFIPRPSACAAAASETAEKSSRPAKEEKRV